MAAWLCQACAVGRLEASSPADELCVWHCMAGDDCPRPDVLQEKEDWINAVGRAIVRHSKSMMDRDQVCVRVLEGWVWGFGRAPKSASDFCGPCNAGRRLVDPHALPGWLCTPGVVV